MDVFLSLLPAVCAIITVLYTLSLRVHFTARWRLRACLKACLIACLGAYLRELRLTKLRFGCEDGFECGHHVGWFRVVRGGAACTLVLVYVSIRLRVSEI